MTILLSNYGYGNDSWRQELTRQLPDMPVYEFGEQFNPSEIKYAMVWNHPAGDFQNYPNLRAIFSLGAGAEHFVADSNLPDIPIVLLADPTVAVDMSSHVLYWVLHFHRQYGSYQSQQKKKLWHRHNVQPAKEFNVGVLGLGRIGTEVSKRIHSFGYTVCGWDLNTRNIESIDSFSGENTIQEFLGCNDLIVNCLPLTELTKHFLDKRLFALMRPGVFFVNISRGAVVKDEDLLESIDGRQVAAAALDAFAVEPLPEDHSYWVHPNVHVTPHVSGATFASSAVELIVDNLHRIESDREPFPLYNRELGY